MKYPHIVVKNGKWYPAGTEVPEDIPTAKAELTYEVPDGALETNADGSVNAYDTDGNKVGTVDAETVQQLQEQTGESFEEPDTDAVDSEKPKRGRKSKEE
jgi:hypothetical protein